MSPQFKVEPDKLPDPRFAVLADIFNQLQDTKQAVDKLGGQLINVVNHVNQTKATMTVLSYLFSRGVTSFRFDKVLVFGPNDIRMYVTTDRGYFAVHIKEKDEMLNVSHEQFSDVTEYRVNMRDWLIYLMEITPEPFKGNVKKEIEAVAV